MSSLHGLRCTQALSVWALALGAALPALAQNIPEKLTIHGYLTQAYAISDGVPSMGMTGEGTSDYRRAALLVRYDASMRDKFIMQLAHRRLGSSPTQAFESDVKLDWAFYEGRFGETARLRVGRVPIPIGIYNETRYVGTLMPFYRAPFAIYSEGSFAAEAIDGVTFTKRFMRDAAYSVEMTAYLGSYGYLESGTMYPPGGEPVFAVARARANRAGGAWVWLTTPIDGLRIGSGFKRARQSEGLFRAEGVASTDDQYFVSVDASFDRAFVRAESRHDRYEGRSTFDAVVVQTGVQVVRNLWLTAQGEAGKVDLAATPFTPALTVNALHRDYALGVNYPFAPNLLAKLEAHTTRGYNVEMPYSFYNAPPLSGRYLISSLSVSF
jgi:hypothetical protein